MKRVLTTKKERAATILKLFDPEAVDYVKEYKDKVDNITVVEFDGHDWVEIDPDEEIGKLEDSYVTYGIEYNLIDGYEDFETIYEALCELEN